VKVTAKDILKTRVECTEFYSKTISNKFSHYISAFCINHNIAPNTITAMMLLSALFCSVLFLQDNLLLNLLGAFLLLSINIFDTSDGEVARYTKKMSLHGIYYDKLFQMLADIMVFSVIGYKQFLFFDTLIYSVPLLMILLFYILDNYSKEIFTQLYSEEDKKNTKSTKLKLSYDHTSKLQFIAHITSSNTGFFHLYWLFLLLDIVMATNFIFQYSYILYFMALQIAKMLQRQKKILTLLGEKTSENL
jgi:phosphatidylglycerophosphate synthase